jgi:N-acetyl-beta-hexosaminidase
MKKLIVGIVLLLNCCGAFGQMELNLVPMPAEVKIKDVKKGFALTPKTKIRIGNHSLRPFADQLNKQLKKLYGFQLEVSMDALVKSMGADINILFSGFQTHGNGNYYIDISKDSILLIGEDKRDFFYGIQTLIQLLPTPNKSSNQKNFQLSIPQLKTTHVFNTGACTSTYAAILCRWNW